MNISEELTTIIGTLTKFLEEYDRGIQKTVVFLDDCESWLGLIKQKCKGNQDVYTISDTKEFRAFIHSNGISKLYIDINLREENGIDLAREMNLQDRETEIFFVSDEFPTDEQQEEISKLGAVFIEKRFVLDQIVYPKEEGA